VRYAAAYIALTALSVAGGRAVALRHNAEGISAGQPSISLGTVELAANSKDKNKDNGAQQPFRMSGSVSNVLPGAPTQLPVVLRNPNKQPLRLETLQVAVADASTACTADNLSVASYSSAAPNAPTYVIPGNGQLTVQLALQFLDGSGNQDACKGKTFPLAFTGSATQAGGAN
jgi:hypothetical protein